MRSNQKRIAWLTLAALLAIGFLLIWVRGRTGQTLAGTVEWRFEVSAFHPNGSCAVPAYWFDTESPANGEIHKRWSDLGRPKVLQVTFVGDLSRVGRWGHLGGYLREVRAVKLIDASAAADACK